MRRSLIKGSGLLLMLLVVLSLLHSCNKPKDVFSNEPDQAPPDFSVVGDTLWAAPSPVDFAAQKCTIKANFSHTITWILKIKGTESGAVKQFTGHSQNLEQVWTGNHDGLYFFKAGEQAEIELTFLGSTKTVKDTVLITVAKKYNGQGIILGSPHREGFEKDISITLSWFYGVYSDGQLDDKEIDVERCGHGSIVKRDTMNPSAEARPVQGNYAMTLAGKDLDGDNFIGGLSYHLEFKETNIIPADPEQVYMNIYLYGIGDVNAKLNCKFTEQKDNEVDDVYQKEFNLSHKGWKLFSVKYSDLELITYSDHELITPGNGIREPKKLSQIGFILISSPPGNKVEATFDFPSITFGAPFDPTK